MSGAKGHSKTVVHDKPLRDLRKQLALMKNSWVTVGVHEDAGSYEAEAGKPPVPVSKVAFWLEQGTQHMPARPFFYPALAGNQDKLKRMFAAAAVRVESGRTTVETALGRVGFAAQTWIQNVIKSNVAPALSEAYAKRRKELYPNQGTRTLIASGLLLRSVRYKLVLGGGEPVLGPGAGGEPAQPPTSTQHTGKSGPEGRAERQAARQGAKDYKASQRAQREAARRDPEGTRQRFLAQRRAYEPHKPKGGG